MVSDIKTVIVTNVPPPYRVPAWRLLAQTEGINLQLVFCSKPHIDTAVSPEEYGFTSHFLTGRYQIHDRRFMHCDLSVWSLLNRLQPDVVITTGYIPTFLFAFAWAIYHGVPHIAMTDGTIISEKSLSLLHRLVRRIVYGFSKAFIGACEGSRKLFLSYGVEEQRIHLAYLCTENQRFSYPPAHTPVDFIFCGRFAAHKQPLFALEVAYQVAVRMQRRISIDFVGSGDMEDQMRSYAAEIAEFVDCRFLGYASQLELPKRYANAKIFLFPSEWDPWGVVANEACAAGLPVIVSPHAGVATELIIDGYNGYICALKLELWVNAAVKLLTDDNLYQTFSKNSRGQVEKYTFENAALGFVEAIQQAYRNRSS